MTGAQDQYKRMAETQCQAPAAAKNQAPGAGEMKKESSYATAGREIVKKAQEGQGIGYRSIAEKYPNFGSIDSGAEDAKTLLETQGTMDLARGSCRLFTARVEASINSARKLIAAHPDKGARTS